MRKIWIQASLALCILLTASGSAHAYNSIGANWNSNYPDVCSALTAASNTCTLCHHGDFSLNPYGNDLAEAGRDFAAIEGDDSDGDGRTNLQEITLDCTLPGDAGSVPVEQDSWAGIKALYR